MFRFTLLIATSIILMNSAALCKVFSLDYNGKPAKNLFWGITPEQLETFENVDVHGKETILGLIGHANVKFMGKTYNAELFFEWDDLRTDDPYLNLKGFTATWRLSEISFKIPRVDDSESFIDIRKAFVKYGYGDHGWNKDHYFMMSTFSLLAFSNKKDPDSTYIVFQFNRSRDYWVRLKDDIRVNNILKWGDIEIVKEYITDVESTYVKERMVQTWGTDPKTGKRIWKKEPAYWNKGKCDWVFELRNNSTDKTYKSYTLYLELNIWNKYSGNVFYDRINFRNIDIKPGAIVTLKEQIPYSTAASAVKRQIQIEDWLQIVW